MRGMGMLHRLGRFLERVFLSEAPRAASVDAGSGLVFAADAEAGAGPSSRSGAAPERRPRPDDPFLLTVDDAGQFLVAVADRLVLGHLQGGRADLPFLADVAARHARLERARSLRAGTLWTLAPCGPEPVEVDGRTLSGAIELADGARVRIGDVRFRYRLPDPASSTALLELEDELECAGAPRVLLFDEGLGGRVRIGASLHRHVRVAGLEQEVELVHEAGRLSLRCDPEESPGFSVPLPLARRLDLSLGRAPGKAKPGRPPFGIGLAPAELPAGSSARPPG